MPDIASRWAQNKLAVVDAVARLFQTGDTFVNLELKLRLRASTGRLNYEEGLVARIHRRRPKESGPIDPDTRAWFGSTVSQVERLDAAIGRLWYTVPLETGNRRAAEQVLDDPPHRNNV